MTRIAPLFCCESRVTNITNKAEALNQSCGTIVKNTYARLYYNLSCSTTSGTRRVR